VSAASPDILAAWTRFALSRATCGSGTCASRSSRRDSTRTWSSASSRARWRLSSRAGRRATASSSCECRALSTRGETAHFDYVAGECAAGLARVADETGVPVAFGVLTTESEEQALERAGGREGNKGADAACAAIELASLMRKLG
jgi:hypothetical protein